MMFEFKRSKVKPGSDAAMKKSLPLQDIVILLGALFGSYSSKDFSGISLELSYKNMSNRN